jgi:hypothetical protein
MVAIDMFISLAAIGCLAYWASNAYGQDILLDDGYLLDLGGGMMAGELNGEEVWTYDFGDFVYGQRGRDDFIIHGDTGTRNFKRGDIETFTVTTKGRTSNCLMLGQTIYCDGNLTIPDYSSD